MTGSVSDGAVLLTTPVEALGDVSAELGAALRGMGLRSVGHLVHHLPHRHEREEAETTIGDLAGDAVVSTRGEVTACRFVGGRGRGKARFEAVLLDGTGRLDVVWFNQPYLRHKIEPGMWLRVQGKSKMKRTGVQIVNPRWWVLKEGEREVRGGGEARLRPVYPATEEAPSWMIERVIVGVLDEALGQIDDHLSEGYRGERSMPSLAEAYRMMHRPADEEEIGVARRRLVYDELLMMQLGVQMRRAKVAKEMHAPALRWSEAIDAHIRARFPFTLTEAQETVVQEIARDVQKSVPMHRLIQGDVGAGKTVVALYAMLMAVASEHQAALMAPTELLAEQHFASISAMLEGGSVRIALLTGSLSAPEREGILARLGAGEIDLLVGTHSVLTESVRFASLGVVVIDEQHRFGVHQRAQLREKSGNRYSMPHTLVMTATPIPRTLALTAFGDLDVSVLRGLPPGRKPVATRMLPSARAEEAYAFVRMRVEKGQQAYVVVPAVDSDGGLKDVRSTVRKLEAGALAGKRVAGVHGRLKRATREQIMERFRGGLIDVLVATTVIEVGVDVANAAVMVVEHADRFGLAQLHQIRGRIGRGTHSSACVLIVDEGATEIGMERVKALVGTTDGFVIAEKDLELRGMGEVLGVRQAGMAPFRLADLSRDLDLLRMARRDAIAWIARSPRLEAPEEALLKRRLAKAFVDGGEKTDV
ncbi:MAG: ATP-dependent DNA helicase RecG [Phycisphaeraceae bacterium]|nr:MAG: ATP-dependent DNA helicase RecG [Phycisphaeraceae bacterium]